MLMKQLTGGTVGGGSKEYETVALMIPSYGTWNTPTTFVINNDGTMTMGSGHSVTGSLLKLDNNSSSGYKFKITALANCKVSGVIYEASSLYASYENTSFTAGQEVVISTSHQAGWAYMVLYAEKA